MMDSHRSVDRDRQRIENGGSPELLQVSAVRQALDYQSTWRALGVCLIGWLILGLVMGVALAAFGGFAERL